MYSPRCAAATLAASLLVGVAVAQPAAEPAASAADGAPQPKLAPLLATLVGSLATSVFRQTVGDELSGLFTRLYQRLRGADRPAAAPPALAPAVGYTIQQLDPATFAVRGDVRVDREEALLRTGDVFALQYSTSLPGQVRLQNVDPEGRVVDLGTYTVNVDQLNRLPADKGIQLQGTPSIERLRIFFFPCMPEQSRTLAWAPAFAARLPACSAGGVGGGGPQIAGAATGTVRTRTLVNLAQPDPTLAFAGLDEYRTNEVLQLELRIRHEARPAATISARGAEPDTQTIIDALKPPAAPSRSWRNLGVRPVEAAASAAAEGPPPRRSIALSVQFDFDSARIRPDSGLLLSNLAEALRSPELREGRFLIEGHTDASGAAAYNQRLSQQRADEVRRFLLARGVEPERIATAGRGAADPANRADPLAPENRRVRVVGLD